MSTDTKPHAITNLEPPKTGDIFSVTYKETNSARTASAFYETQNLNFKWLSIITAVFGTLADALQKANVASAKNQKEATLEDANNAYCRMGGDIANAIGAGGGALYGYRSMSSAEEEVKPLETANKNAEALEDQVINAKTRDASLSDLDPDSQQAKEQKAKDELVKEHLSEVRGKLNNDKELQDLTESDGKKTVKEKVVDENRVEMSREDALTKQLTEDQASDLQKDIRESINNRQKKISTAYERANQKVQTGQMIGNLFSQTGNSVTDGLQGHFTSDKADYESDGTLAQGTQQTLDHVLQALQSAGASAEEQARSTLSGYDAVRSTDSAR